MSGASEVVAMAVTRKQCYNNVFVHSSTSSVEGCQRAMLTPVAMAYTKIALVSTTCTKFGNPKFSTRLIHHPFVQPHNRAPIHPSNLQSFHPS